MAAISENKTNLDKDLLEVSENEFGNALKTVIFYCHKGDPKAKEIIVDIERTLKKYYTEEELEPIFNDILGSH